MTLRKIFFWLHLAAGAIAGIVILIMSVTGLLLMYEKQIIEWADQRGYRSAPPPGAPRLPVETLIATVRDARQANAGERSPYARILRRPSCSPSDARVRSLSNPYTGADPG